MQKFESIYGKLNETAIALSGDYVIVPESKYSTKMSVMLKGQFSVDYPKIVVIEYIEGKMYAHDDAVIDDMVEAIDNLRSANKDSKLPYHYIRMCADKCGLKKDGKTFFQEIEKGKERECLQKFENLYSGISNIITNTELDDAVAFALGYREMN